MMDLSRCPRCGRKKKNLRQLNEHLRRPCADDNVLVRRRKSAEKRASGVPERPNRRGRKLYMTPDPSAIRDAPVID